MLFMLDFNCPHCYLLDFKVLNALPQYLLKVLVPRKLKKCIFVKIFTLLLNMKRYTNFHAMIRRGTEAIFCTSVVNNTHF